VRPAVAEAAERILGRAGGAAVRLTRWEPLRGGDRSKVWRARVHGGPADTPASVVVKTAVAADREDYDPDADGTGPAWRLFNEWASLELLGRLAPERRLAPRLYGGDRAVGVLVLEDVRAGAGLDRLLLGDDPDAAEDAMVGHAGALGRMHAIAVAHEDEYAALRAGLGPLPPTAVSTAAEAALDGEGLVAAFRRAAAGLGVALGGPATGDLEEVAALWGSPTVRTLVHGDACPDNCRCASGEVRLIDFEFGGFRHPLIDGACTRLCYPSCWCAGTIPERVVRRAEAAYRAALVGGGGWAADDVAFGRALVEGCAYWMIGMFAWAVPDLLGGDVAWGLASGRQRVLHRLGLFAEIGDERRHLQALGSAARSLRARLAARWPEAGPLAAFPAFRSERA